MILHEYKSYKKLFETDLKIIIGHLHTDMAPGPRAASRASYPASRASLDICSARRASYKPLLGSLVNRWTVCSARSSMILDPARGHSRAREQLANMCVFMVIDFELGITVTFTCCPVRFTLIYTDIDVHSEPISRRSHSTSVSSIFSAAHQVPWFQLQFPAQEHQHHPIQKLHHLHEEVLKQHDFAESAQLCCDTGPWVVPWRVNSSMSWPLATVEYWDTACDYIKRQGMPKRILCTSTKDDIEQRTYKV